MKFIVLVVILPCEALVGSGRCAQGDAEGIVHLSQELPFEFPGLPGIGSESERILSKLGSEERTKAARGGRRIAFRVKHLRQDTVLF